jgi:CheY-like chemotaxis protein
MGSLSASGAMAKQGPETDTAARGAVLLVDDEQSIARAYARTLGTAGFTVEIAFDGKAAAAAARERHFDVIVSDIAMPEMNGLELLRTVREHDLDVPFVLMTGGPAVESAVRAVEYGALRYLIKPISAAELEEVVARAVRLHQMARIKREALEMFRIDGKHLGDRAGLEARFASALSSLWIAYQPIVSWSRRTTFAHEALSATRSRRCARRPICSRRPSGSGASRSWGARCAIASPRPWTRTRSRDCSSSTCTPWSWRMTG